MGSVLPGFGLLDPGYRGPDYRDPDYWDSDYRSPDHLDTDYRDSDYRVPDFQGTDVIRIHFTILHQRQITETPNKIGNLQARSDLCFLHSPQMVTLFDALQSLAVIVHSLYLQYIYDVVLLLPLRAVILFHSETLFTYLG